MWQVQYDDFTALNALIAVSVTSQRCITCDCHPVLCWGGIVSFDNVYLYREGWWIWHSVREKERKRLKKYGVIEWPCVTLRSWLFSLRQLDKAYMRNYKAVTYIPLRNRARMNENIVQLMQLAIFTYKATYCHSNKHLNHCLSSDGNVQRHQSCLLCHSHANRY